MMVHVLIAPCPKPPWGTPDKHDATGLGMSASWEGQERSSLRDEGSYRLEHAGFKEQNKHINFRIFNMYLLPRAQNRVQDPLWGTPIKVYVRGVPNGPFGPQKV